jgi:hypothetical protein
MNLPHPYKKVKQPNLFAKISKLRQGFSSETVWSKAMTKPGQLTPEQMENMKHRLLSAFDKAMSLYEQGNHGQLTYASGAALALIQIHNAAKEDIGVPAHTTP